MTLTASLFMISPISASAVTIEPLRQTIVVDAGERRVVRVEVTNDAEEAQRFAPAVDAFAVDEQTGAAVFGQEAEAIDWIRYDQNVFELQPGETQTMVFTITVPPDVGARSHYLGLFARSLPESGTVGLGSRVGSLLFLHTAGDFSESVSVKGFTLDRSTYFSSPLRVSLELENTGTAHVHPAGKIALIAKDGTEVASQQINRDQRLMIPGGTWRETYTFSSLPTGIAGEVTAVATIRYGVTDQQITDVRRASFVRLWSILGLAGAVLVAALLIVYTTSKIRQRSV